MFTTPPPPPSPPYPPARFCVFCVFRVRVLSLACYVLSARQVRLVAIYAATLPVRRRRDLYARFLRSVEGDGNRLEALEQAKQHMAADVPAIVKKVLCCFFAGERGGGGGVTGGCQCSINTTKQSVKTALDNERSILGLLREVKVGAVPILSPTNDVRKRRVFF